MNPVPCKRGFNVTKVHSRIRTILHRRTSLNNDGIKLNFVAILVRRTDKAGTVSEIIYVYLICLSEFKICITTYCPYSLVFIYRNSSVIYCLGWRRKWFQKHKGFYPSLTTDNKTTRISLMNYDIWKPGLWMLPLPGQQLHLQAKHILNTHILMFYLMRTGQM